MRLQILFGLMLLISIPIFSAPIANSTDLEAAISQGKSGDVLELAQGTFTVKQSLQPKAKMKIRGAGMGKTVIQGDASWDPGLLTNKDDRSPYLFSLDKSHGISFSNITFKGPKLYGAISSNRSDSLTISNCHFENFLYNSIRTVGGSGLRVGDCLFIDAGGKMFNETGGALFNQWCANAEFWNNRIQKRDTTHSNFFGFKGRECKDCHFHHNTVEVSFSLEYPFDNDKNVEIDHNRFTGVISIPKHAGGPVATAPNYGFYIHHNWLSRSYALEWTRNSAIIEYNLFEFSTKDDGGNLISSFGSEPAPGPTVFRNNLIKNPGRGLAWINQVYNNYSFTNNHVKANTLTRKEGLFGFNPKTDFSTIVISNNIFELDEQNPRPLLRNSQSYASTIKNNTFININDADKIANPNTGDKKGPLEPLKFQVGVNGEYTVNGWDVTNTNGGTTVRQKSIQLYQRKYLNMSWKFFEEPFDLLGRQSN